MVKGVCRQVIVMHAPEPRLFEQAIFILKDNVGEGVTDELLLKEAKQVILESACKHRRIYLYGAFWACMGALATGLVWLSMWLL